MSKITKELNKVSKQLDKASSVNKTANGEMKKKIKSIMNRVEKRALENAEIFNYVGDDIEWAYARAVIYLTAFGKELDSDTKKYIKKISRSSDYFSMSVDHA